LGRTGGTHGAGTLTQVFRGEEAGNRGGLCCVCWGVLQKILNRMVDARKGGENSSNHLGAEGGPGQRREKEKFLFGFGEHGVSQFQTSKQSMSQKKGKGEGVTGYTGEHVGASRTR